MAYGDSLLNALKEWQIQNPDDISIPQALVTKMMDTERRLSYESGQKNEREELICRLLASGMPADEISLILKIRVEEIRDIEAHNGNKVADYTKKLKARRKGRERAAENHQKFLDIISDKQV